MARMRIPISFMPARRAGIAGLLMLGLLATLPVVAAPPPEILELRGYIRADAAVPAESLATVLIAREEGSAQPDSVVLAEAYYSVCAARNARHAYGEARGLEAGMKALTLIAALPQAPDTLRFLSRRHVGWTLMYQGRALLACDHFREAWRVARRHPEWGPPETVIMFNFATALSNAGKVDSALVVFGEALELRRRLKLPRDPLIGELHAYMGTAWEQLNRSDRAEEAYEQAMREHTERLGPDHRILIGLLSRMAAFEFRRGDYARSVDFNQRSLDIGLPTLGPDHINMLISDLAVAQALDQLGDFQRARLSLERVLPKLETTLGFGSSPVLNGWLSLASSYSRLGRPAEALAIYDRMRAFYGADSTLVERAPLAAALTSAAGLRARGGEYAAGRALAQEAEAVNRAANSPELSITLQALSIQYECAARSGDREGAEQINRRIDVELDRCALASNNLTDDVWVTRSQVARSQGRVADAIAAAATGARLERERLARNARGLSDRQALLLSQTLARCLDALIEAGALAGPDEARLCWDAVVRTRGLVRAEVSRRRLLPREAADSALAARHADWVAAETELARLEVRLASSPRDAEADSLLTAARAAVDETERRFARDFPAAAPAGPADRVDLAQVASRLRSDQALVGYVTAPGADAKPHLLAFVTTGGSAPSAAGPAVTCLDLGSVDALEPLVTAWRQALGETRAARRSEAACRRAGRALRARVWDPVAKATAGAAEVFLVPEAPVAGLPWGALPAGERGYLVETGPAIRVLDAERELLSDPEAPAGSGLLALGGADYDRSGSEPGAAAPLAVARLRGGPGACGAPALPRFTPLPGTLGEVRAVEAAWNRADATPVERLEADRAGEAAFKERAAGRRVLHLATHGLTLGDDCPEGAEGTRGVGGIAPVTAAATPLATSSRRKARPAATETKSADVAPGPSPWLGRRVLLALAGANRPPSATPDENEGLLSAEEVMTLDLSGVEWVVLSACHSAAGESWAREGVLGLTRAFHLAGARTVIASQWPVEDDATRECMTALYETRAGGTLDGGFALAEASRRVLIARRAAGRSTHPFYWAAFTASGR